MVQRSRRSAANPVPSFRCPRLLWGTAPAAISLALFSAVGPAQAQTAAFSLSNAQVTTYEGNFVSP